MSDATARLHDCIELRQAIPPNLPALEQTAVPLVTKRFSMLEIRVAILQLFRQLGVLDEMPLSFGFCTSRRTAESSVHSQFLLKRSRGRQPDAKTTRRIHGESCRENRSGVRDIDRCADAAGLFLVGRWYDAITLCPTVSRADHSLVFLRYYRGLQSSPRGRRCRCGARVGLRTSNSSRDCSIRLRTWPNPSRRAPHRRRNRAGDG